MSQVDTAAQDAKITGFRVNRHNILRLALPVALGASLLGVAACNEEKKTAIEEYGADSAVAITNFKLKADSKVLTNLDSVFFSIDLKNGVVFNADSLPAGTKVTDLIPVISYPSSTQAAVITMEGGEKREGEVDYYKNPSDSIDFTGNVSIKLTAQDGVTTRTYRLKVNVHKLVSDSLMWDKVAVSPIPSRSGNPTAQKSVSRDNTAYCLVREQDGSLSIATSATPGPDSWQIRTVAENGTFDIRTFSVTDDAFYILDTDGRLYSSEDAVSWTDTGKRWINIIGGYQSTLLGIDSENGTLRHAYYPANFTATPLESGFPVKGYSNTGIFSNKWSVEPICLMVGGYDADGQTTDGVWAFDGGTWAKLSEHPVGKISGGALIPYYIYRTSKVSWIQTEFQVWLLLGGTLPDGTLNRTVYLSYDNGVNWQQAVDYMQLPEYIPSLTQCDPMVLTMDKNASISDAWTKKPSRRVAPWYIKHETDGDNISWQCPYIYLFGGINADGAFSNAVWRGVLNKLTFTPLI